MNVFLDLDGTLTDPAPGITRCISHALTTIGLDCPDDSALERYIGPPLQDTFRELMPAAETALLDEALRLHRERFVAAGMFENSVYPDVPEGLARLKAQGHRLWVVTSKPHVYARRILQHFSLSDWFEGTYGAELSGQHSDKTSLVRSVLTNHRMACSDSCMVGDRAQDVVGAKANGIRAIGVLWGYGSAAELEGAGADLLASSMAEVKEGIGCLTSRWS